MPDDAAFQITQAIARADLPVKVLILGPAESKEDKHVRSVKRISQGAFH